MSPQSSAADPPLAPGTLLHDRYRLVGVAGKGRFGQIYLARDQKRHDQLCVLKEFVAPVTETVVLQNCWRAFQAAAACLYSLQHPQLPRFQVMIAQGQRFYWVREYIEGQSYAMLLEERGATGWKLSEPEVMQFLKQVLPVLSYLHDRGVVHGNLSPESVICREGDRAPVLIDFGLVQDLLAWLRSRSSETQAATEAVLPPESGNLIPFVPAQPLQPRDDLTALAVTAIVLLTGQHPQAPGNAWQSGTIVQPPLRQILRRMLDPRSAERFTSANQVLRALQMMQQDKLPAASQQGRFLQSRNLRFAVVGLNLSLLVAIGLWTFRPPAPPTPPPSPTSPISTPSPNAPPRLQPSIVPVPTLPPPPPELEPPQSSARPALPANLIARQQQLEIDPQFFDRLTDEALISTPIPDRAINPSPAPAERSAIASALMDKLQTLSPAARRKLGTYRRADYDQWLAQLGETGTTSRILDTLADDRLAELFPTLRGRDLNPRTFGQVWYAIAEAQVSVALAQKATSKPGNR